MLKTVTALVLLGASFGMPATAATASRANAVMYKNPGCECCDGHAAALRNAGLNVKVVPTQDLAALKARAGVPDALQGCHTTVMGGYAVEGHVPISAVQRMLKEKPAIRGIALPGMPSGSPGMAGPKTASFKVLSFGARGTKLYAVE